jgi:hypothetical protein
MFTSKRFELTHSTLALDAANQHKWVTIPAGAIIRVVGPNDEEDRMLDVRWEGRPLVMFAIDLTAGGTEIQNGRAQELSQKGGRV